MAITVKDKLNQSNPNDVPAWQRKLFDTTESLGYGDMLAALRIRPARARTGLTSSATQVHDVAPCGLYAVYITAGTPLAMIAGAAPGAGEVRVEFDATTGVPTFTFAGATDTYTVIEGGPLPQNTSTVMAETVLGG